MLQESYMDVDPINPAPPHHAKAWGWFPLLVSRPPAPAAAACCTSGSFHVKAVMQKKKKARGYFFFCKLLLSFMGCRGSRGPGSVFCLGCWSQVSGCCRSSDLCRGFCPSGSRLARILLFAFSGQHKILLKFLPPHPPAPHTPVFSIIKRLEIFA